MTPDIPKAAITTKHLRDKFSYDPSTGILTHNLGRRKGKLVGGKNCHGYWRLFINHHQFYHHRIIWQIMTGEKPDREIDHANSDRSDNRWSNLRLASRAENQRNSVIRKDNNTGVRGVVFRHGKFIASIRHKKRRLHLGAFEKLSDAANAYKQASLKLHGEFSPFAHESNHV